MGDYYEKEGTTVRKTYYAGGARVAMREAGTLYYILTDHLGSTAITINSAGTAEVGELRYYAYGKTRYSSGTTPTDRRFTGQISDDTIGLYFYNARYYDAALGRFVSADTIVPSPSDPQSLNRYSYVLGNPLRYNDPTGHYIFEETPEDSWMFSSAAVRSAHYYTHPEYEHGRVSDAEIFRAATSVFWAPAAAAVAPEIIGAGEAALWKAIVWAANNPVKAYIARAVGEELFEAWGTGTPPDPMMVAMDLASAGILDDLLPRRPGIHGGPAHEKPILDIQAEIGARGYQPDTEWRVHLYGSGTEGKKWRQMDVAALDPSTKTPVLFYQVGDITQSGIPVARERRAIIDVTEFSPYYHVPIFFRPKEY